MVKATDFKFDTHLLSDKTDMTPQFLFKKGHSQGHVTPNFWGKGGATDFKFGMQVFRDNNTDMTPNIFLQKGRGQGRVTANFPTHLCLRPPLGGTP